MAQIDEVEIHKIVQKVIGQMQGMVAEPNIDLFPITNDNEEPDINLQVHQTQIENKGNQVIAVGADHGGFLMKTELIAYIEKELGYNVTDCGTRDTSSVDYPDYAYAVARLVADGKARYGIVIDGAGIGSCMVANKVFGIRAAMCYDHATAINSREHNNANLLTLGAGLIGLNLAKQIVKTWLETEFLGGRHASRVDKIMAIEKKYLRG